MKVRTDVEVVIGALDQGIERVLNRIDQNAKTTQASVSGIDKTIKSVVGAVASLKVLEKIGKYALDVGRAADESSRLGQVWNDAEDAFGLFKATADDVIGALLVELLPPAIDLTLTLADALRDAAKALGLIGNGEKIRAAREQAAALRQDLISQPAGGRPGPGGPLGDLLRESLGQPANPDLAMRAQLEARVAELEAQAAALEAGDKGGGFRERFDARRAASEAEHKRDAEARSLGLDSERMARESKRNERFAGAAFIPEPEIQGPVDDPSRARDQAAAALAESKEAERRAAQDAAQAMRQQEQALMRQEELLYANRDATTALSDGWEQFGSRFANTGAVLEEGVVSLGGSLANNLSASLFDVISKSKDADEAFKDLAKTFVAQLGQIATSYLIAYLFKQLFFGGATPVPGAALHGGTFGGRGSGEPAFRHHEMMHGGVAGGRSVVVYGEGSRREAFVPLADGRSIPVRIEGGAASSNRTDVFVYAMDSRNVVDVLSQHGAVYRTAVKEGVSRRSTDRRAFQQALR